VSPTQGGSSPAPAAAQAEVYSAPRQDKPWGHELIFAAVDGLYAGKIIQVRAGHALSLQYHRDKDETISVLAGEALFEYGPDVDELTERRFGPGDTIHLPAGARHRVTAITDLTFAEASTAAPGWREDVVRLEDKYGRTGTSAP
jgi:mannose-6-phosphate isomerase